MPSALCSSLTAAPCGSAGRAVSQRSFGAPSAASAAAGHFLGSSRGLLSLGRTSSAPCHGSSRRHQGVVASTDNDSAFKLNRRELVSGTAATTAMLLATPVAYAYEDDDIRLITEEMEKDLASIPMITTASGLQYKDIKVGKGPNPPRGFQVTVKYVAMVPKDPFGKKPGPRVFDSSIEKKKPYDIRLGTGSVVPGLDEGIASMKQGGLRRLYIPGELSFPNGLVAAPGRPRVPPKSEVIFDVELLLIPGFDEYDEDEVIPEVDTTYSGFGADGA